MELMVSLGGKTVEQLERETRRRAEDLLKDALQRYGFSLESVPPKWRHLMEQKGGSS
jgi:hypothetical protein